MVYFAKILFSKLNFNWIKAQKSCTIMIYTFTFDPRHDVMLQNIVTKINRIFDTKTKR